MSRHPKDPMSQFNIAFVLMSVIPLLIFCYLLTVKFFTVKILEGLNGVYVFLAVLIAFLGLVAGRQAIGQILQQLVVANAKLERLNDQQAAFVSNVAHEFRSPLSVMQGAMDNLADSLHGPLSSDQREPVAMCRRETGRLNRLVGDLLDVAQIESGKIHLVQEPLVLQEVLQASARLFHDQLTRRGLSFDMELPSEPASLLGDKDRLQQVFVNLLGNAAKFTERGGIRVRLEKDRDAFQIEVIDTGPGIAAGDLERVFDKFERVGSRTEEGSGLGLPIARDLVRLHHGRLWAQSEPGQGSRFIVRLPEKPPAPA